MIARRHLVFIAVMACSTSCRADRMASGSTTMPIPSGIYVLNDPSNEQPTSTAYAAGLETSEAYLNDVTGHAVFVPIAKILPSITTWGQFNWSWGYLDTLVQAALSHQKKFSIELETGYQTGGTYLQSLPAGFAATCGAGCAPLFDVWTTGGAVDRCISAYILLPWVPNVREFWSAAATALAAHLQAIGAYASLTLVHVPGLSVYDEEIRLPTGRPAPTSTDTLPCADGRPAYPTVLSDADTSHWRSLGYSDTAVVNGFAAIATSFAHAFPDRFLGLSLFNPGAIGIDFPNLTGDPPGYVAAQIVQAVSRVAPGRVQLQADFLDNQAILPEVTSLASQYADSVGWQSNKHGGTGSRVQRRRAGNVRPRWPGQSVLPAAAVRLAEPRRVRGGLVGGRGGVSPEPRCGEGRGSLSGPLSLRRERTQPPVRGRPTAQNASDAPSARPPRGSGATATRRGAS